MSDRTHAVDARPRTRALTLVLGLVAAMALVAVTPPPFANADHTEIQERTDDLVESVRWAGVDRWDTAAKIAVEFSAAATDEPATSAIVARSADFPDALAGSYLSGAADAPILLTARDELTEASRARLTSDEDSGLGEVETVYLLGRTNAIGEPVADELTALGYEVVRIGGVDRYETAADIATTSPDATVGEVDGMRTVVLALGTNFPDALVAGATSVGGSLPILLTRTDTIPDVTVDAMAELDVEQVVIAGRTDAVSQAVEDQITSLGYDVRRVGGSDRTGTAAAFALFNQDELGFGTDEVVLARGDDYADSLSVGPFAGRESISIALARAPQTIGSATPELLRGLASCTFNTLYVPGGTAAVSAEVETEARGLLDADDCPTELTVTTEVDGDDVDATDTTCDDGTGECTLRAAITTANAITGPTTIILPAGTYALTTTGADEDGNATGDLDVTEELTIVGDGAETTIIDASALDDRALEVVSGSLDITGVTVTGGDASNDAVVDERNGGGINASGGALTVADSVFTANTASRAGGAIEATGVALTVTDTDFVGNEATGDGAPGNGGAIHATGDSTITGGTVDGNIAVEGGGFWNGGGTMTVTDTTFTANTGTGDEADQGGGALYNNGGTLVVDAITATGNTATGTSGNGGGILTLGDLTVTDSTIVDGTANRAGGGIEVAAIEGADAPTVTVADTDFAGNSIADANPGVGGAIHVTAGSVDVTGGTVAGNTAVNGGGFWVNAGSTLDVTATEFDANVATGEGAGTNGGGALFNNGGSLSVTDGVFTANTAVEGAGSGGAIMTLGDLTVDGADTEFDGNLANRAGGAIEVQAPEGGDAPTVLVQDALFTANDALGAAVEGAPGVGGAVHVTSGDVTVTGTVANDNTAAANGGALWVNAGSTLTVSDAEFQRNDAAVSGGALFNNGGVMVLEGIEAPGGLLANTAGDDGDVYGQNDANPAGSPSTSASDSILDNGLVSGNDTCTDLLTDEGGNTNPDGTCIAP